jgi:TRAP-type uncharacterized transport system substrate-binding protein
VSLAVAFGALFFRDLDLVPDLSYVDIMILSGSPEGQYHAMVERLINAAAEQNAKISNISTRGSRENLDRLLAAQKNCDVQLSLVQDGFDPLTYKGLELIGRVGRTETLFLMGRKGDSIQRLTDLRGLKIGVEPEGSGSAFLAERLLSATDLSSLEIKLEHYALKQQAEMAATGELDLALFIIDEDADLIVEAVRDKGLQIVGLEHTEAIARRFPFVSYGTIAAGQYDPLRVLPPLAKPILRLDTLLLSNGCASQSDIVGIMTLLERANPNFIERNRAMKIPAGLVLSESARGFYENQGAEFADEYLPWLVDIMPPSN